MLEYAFRPRKWRNLLIFKTVRSQNPSGVQFYDVMADSSAFVCDGTEIRTSRLSRFVHKIIIVTTL